MLPYWRIVKLSRNSPRRRRDRKEKLSFPFYPCFCNNRLILYLFRQEDFYTKLVKNSVSSLHMPADFNNTPGMRPGSLRRCNTMGSYINPHGIQIRSFREANTQYISGKVIGGACRLGMTQAVFQREEFRTGTKPLSQHPAPALTHDAFRNLLQSQAVKPVKNIEGKVR